MKSHYTVAEFAELAGVTVKALHLYDRLGLLQRRGRRGGGEGRQQEEEQRPDHDRALTRRWLDRS